MGETKFALISERLGLERYETTIGYQNNPEVGAGHSLRNRNTSCTSRLECVGRLSLCALKAGKAVGLMRTLVDVQ